VFYSKKSFHSEYIPSNTYLITSNKGNTKFHFTSVFTFCEKKYRWSRSDPSILPLRPATPPNSESISSGEHPSDSTTSLLHQCPKDPWRSSGRFLHKNKRSSRWRSHLHLEHTFKKVRPKPSSAHLKKHQRASRSPPKLWQGPELQTDSSKTRGSNVQPRWNSKTHKTVMISHHVLVRRRRGLALEEIVIHRRSHNKKTLLSLSSPRRTEGIPMCEAPAFEQTKPARHEWITVKSY